MTPLGDSSDSSWRAQRSTLWGRHICICLHLTTASKQLAQMSQTRSCDMITQVAAFETFYRLAVKFSLRLCQLDVQLQISTSIELLTNHKIECCRSSEFCQKPSNLVREMRFSPTVILCQQRHAGRFLDWKRPWPLGCPLTSKLRNQPGVRTDLFNTLNDVILKYLDFTVLVGKSQIPKLSISCPAYYMLRTIRLRLFAETDRVEIKNRRKRRAAQTEITGCSWGVNDSGLILVKLISWSVWKDVLEQCGIAKICGIRS